ncbi:hypothetical protein [Microbacterium foliorum]|uniref:hypothetical protein n=1 Tax=Microbacterium foliorum TaxID=104336 RepID=UPI001D7234A3|nr:hypothetical protein [Microbacterium foliorum]CAH0139044.1 hypothetical protein SRABI03_00468 [Microbacterium foliorum]CAH0207941.1 hypothetical protein SRABI44_02096 [Microbacterium foliorum]
MRDAPLVPGVHRVIRRLDADEGPFAGSLVVRGGSAAVLVDAAELGGWAGWAHAGDEHVAAPVDLARRPGGHDVLLPWCTERVGALLGRRTLAEMPLAAGEMTTLVASLLRGVAELISSDDGDCAGEWWLTDDGRPLFVIGSGADVCAATARLVEQLHQGCGDRALSRLLGHIAEGLRAAGGAARMSTRRLERWETDLLDTAAPRPLQRSVQEPVRVRDLDAGRRVVPAPVSRRDGRIEGTSRSSPSVVVRRIVVAGATSVAEIASRGVRVLRGLRMLRVRRPAVMAEGRRAAHDDGKVPGRPNRSRTRHRRAALVAAVTASVVLAAGLLWPAGATQGRDEPAEGPLSGEAAGAEAHGHEAPSGPPTPAEPADDVDRAGDTDPADPEGTARPEDSAESEVAPSTSDDPVLAAPAVLAMLTTCLAAGDAVCAGAVTEGSATASSTFGKAIAETAEGDEDRLTFAPVDQYGDLAVVRVSSPVHDAQEAAPALREWMLVLVRIEEKWLVRDAYDVADQPG